MKAQIFFSVIIPTHDRSHFLKKAVDSVLAQTYPHYELIIIDDGSSDGTEELVAGYDDERITYLKTPRRGVAAARNRGLALAQGEMIAFLDSDDMWTEEKLAITASCRERYPEYKVFHTQEIWLKDGHVLAQRKKHLKPDGWAYRQALKLCCISISTASVDKRVFDATEVFDESFTACEDYDLWLRLTSRYPVKLIDRELTIKHGGRPDQLSASVWGLDRFRIKALEKMLRSNVLSEENRRLTIKELERKCRIFAQGALKRGRTDEYEHYSELSGKYT